MAIMAEMPGGVAGQTFDAQFRKAFENYVNQPSQENFKALQQQIIKFLENPNYSATYKRIIENLNEVVKKFQDYFNEHKEKISQLEKKLKDPKISDEQKAAYESALSRAKSDFEKIKTRIQDELSKLRFFLSTEEKKPTAP